MFLAPADLGDSRDDFPPQTSPVRVLEFAERTFYAAKARRPLARSIADADHTTIIVVEWKANLHLGRGTGSPVGEDCENEQPVGAVISEFESLERRWALFR